MVLTKFLNLSLNLNSGVSNLQTELRMRCKTQVAAARKFIPVSILLVVHLSHRMRKQSVRLYSAFIRQFLRGFAAGSRDLVLEVLTRSGRSAIW